MKKYQTALLIFALVLFLPLQSASAKEIVGWVEKVRLYPGGLTIKAKIDTGAKSSSLNCNCITPIERDGEKWVRFSVTNDTGKRIFLERKIIGVSTIKRHFGESQERYVVRLGLCLGSVYKETDFNLIDRTGLNYQLLIGRRFLEGTHIVDPDSSFLTKPRCKRDFLHE
jgi:hypothetical protein